MHISPIYVQCKASYHANWTRGIDERCPDLIPTIEERRIANFQNFTAHYDSIAGMWSDWNGLYLNAKFPRLVIRFEDTIFHLETVMKKVSECVGIPMDGPLKYHLDSSKHLRSSADFVSAMSRYGKAEGRYDGFSVQERKYLQTALDPQLMQIFRYPQIPLDQTAAST
jgi:hypothetical protein